jgi:hypothetical protein
MLPARNYTTERYHKKLIIHSQKFWYYWTSGARLLVLSVLYLSAWPEQMAGVIWA